MSDKSYDDFFDDQDRISDYDDYSVDSDLGDASYDDDYPWERFDKEFNKMKRKKKEDFDDNKDW